MKCDFYTFRFFFLCRHCLINVRLYFAIFNRPKIYIQYINIFIFSTNNRQAMFVRPNDVSRPSFRLVNGSNASSNCSCKSISIRKRSPRLSGSKSFSHRNGLGNQFGPFHFYLLFSWFSDTQFDRLDSEQITKNNFPENEQTRLNTLVHRIVGSPSSGRGNVVPTPYNHTR